MGFRDREVNFLPIDGTAIADAGNQEDSVDLSNYGVSVGNLMGMRIWKVEIAFRNTDDWGGANPATDSGSVVVRTITSGGTQPDMNDDGVIAMQQQFVAGFTTSGSQMQPLIIEHGTVFPRGLLVVTDRLYVQVQNESGVTRAARVRIWYTLEHMTKDDWREAFEVWRRA